MSNRAFVRLNRITDRPKYHGLRTRERLRLQAIQQIPPVCPFLPSSPLAYAPYFPWHRISGYALITLLGLTLAWGGLWSNFTNKHTWTATRYIVYCVGSGSVVGGVLARARCVFLFLWDWGWVELMYMYVDFGLWIAGDESWDFRGLRWGTGGVILTGGVSFFVWHVPGQLADHCFDYTS